MKKAYSIILLLLFISISLVSQTGTIKIAKPVAPKKDTVVPKGFLSLYEVRVAGNYTFKGIHKYGYEAEVLWIHGVYIGIKYSNEIEYYRLSAYNKETALPETAIGKSETHSDYIKIPLGIAPQIVAGSNLKMYFSLGLCTEYLIKTKNEFRRLNESDFNRFNLAGTASVGVPFLKHYLIRLSYSKDFFDNLKDKNMYDGTGMVIGKQKSKTGLAALSISYLITRK